ncbi:Hypothetical Protein FCC1311_034742 [Hondaea fermentalgiana]|uniref:Uncharacterized protein n=1 Tax=Hondaea fermentalgiana TaxID=2315210 RepID=A0A2R5G869_9STRA|nr:Hypothetical Protein FCC1311_034742 [Hondaea fermentalgiana]|eukprot:GBG27252.1 Hypothetical Protein FCC1311_034742 [Hondaea fermentalgiana]
MAVFALHMEEGEKRATLVQGAQSKNVSVLHVNKNGDVLVHDGKRILMIPKKSLVMPCCDQSESEKKDDEEDEEHIGSRASAPPMNSTEAIIRACSREGKPESEGRTRLALVRSIYHNLMKGEVSTRMILAECKRFGFLR